MNFLSVDIPNYVDSFETGSRYICNPAPMDTDLDMMVLVTEGALNYVEDDLIIAGFKLGGSEDFESNWCSFKKDDLNILVTDDQEYYVKFREATEEAKRLNLLNKKDRIKLIKKYLDAY
jgi:hypothetical protein